MIYQTFIVAVCLSVIGNTRAKTTYDCETNAKATASLDLAIQLIRNVKDNYPVRSSELLPIDCEDILQNGRNRSGVYEVWPRSRAVLSPFSVYCDMDTDGGGWTVIQRRGNFQRPKDFFYQDWISYKEGFGNVAEDFWLGNDNIFGLSNQKEYSIRFDLQDVESNRRYALYNAFWIDDEEHQYALHIEGYSGDAGDSMLAVHNGQKFSTKDSKDVIQSSFQPHERCAEKYKGGWWYRNNRCHTANLNGLYHRGKHESYADGVNWHEWKDFNESLEFTEIKIRSKHFKK